MRGPTTRTPGAPRSGWRHPASWLAVAGLAGVILGGSCLRRETAPEAISQVPEFTLIDTTGRPFGSADLSGQVYVVNFIFTRCTSICPMLTRTMSRLQERLEASGLDGIRLVSITVDPGYDTPERLAKYAAEHGADPRRWSFLTGERETIEALVVGGFKAAMGPEPPSDLLAVDIAHSGKFVLVDGTGAILGYYGFDPTGQEELLRTSRTVLAEQRR